MMQIQKAILSLFLLTAVTSQAQSLTYDECVNYAMMHNNSIRSSRLTEQSGKYDTEAAKATKIPTLSFSTTHGYTNYPVKSKDSSQNVYAGTYGLNASWNLYNGGIRGNNIKRAEISEQIDELSTSSTSNTVEMNILRQYLNILYSQEAIAIKEGTATVSKSTSDRAEQMLNVGSISKSEYSQLYSQYNSDIYGVISAKSDLASQKVDMKNLLNMGIAEDIDLANITFSEEQVLQPIPSKVTVYNMALTWMPEFKGYSLKKEVANLDKKIAKGGYYPTIDLNAGVGTGHSTGTGISFGTQVGNKLNEQISVTLSVPILDNKKNKVAVSKANIDILSADLDKENAEISLQKEIENVYVDAVSAQAQYRASQTRVKAYTETYELLLEQFKVGKKNALDLLTAQNDLQAAKIEELQAKYMSIMSLKLLDFYMGNKITL